MSGARLIHLNGPPGIGKTTLARRYAAEHPGVLLCDIDVLRTMIGGWQDDDGAAERARTAALALVTGYLSTGYDVVLPQLVARHDQLARFADRSARSRRGTRPRDAHDRSGDRRPALPGAGPRPRTTSGRRTPRSSGPRRAAMRRC